MEVPAAASGSGSAASSSTGPGPVVPMVEAAASGSGSGQVVLAPAPPAATVLPPQGTFFQVIRAWTNQGKDRVVPTAETRTAQKSALTFVLQYYEVRDPDRDCSEAGATRVEVFQDTDPVSVAWDGVAAWDLMRKHLQRWRSEESDNDGCLWLTDPARVRNRLPLDDPRVPTLCCVEALHDAGFIARESPSQHCLPPIEHPYFDAREAVRMKPYYQALLRGASIFTFRPVWSSTEPVSFSSLFISRQSHRDRPGRQALQSPFVG